ncbi:MAG: hypothetical protein ACXWKQ_20270, partial [Reyranella sp.]
NGSFRRWLLPLRLSRDCFGFRLLRPGWLRDARLSLPFFASSEARRGRLGYFRQCRLRRHAGDDDTREQP